MKRVLISVVFGLWVLLGVNAQVKPDWYPKADAAIATYINHEGEEEEIEVGGTYDAPFTLTFMANPTDTTGYNVLYEWEIVQIKNGVEKLLAKRNEETTTFTFTEGGVDVSYRVVLYFTYSYREGDITGEGETEPITFSLRGSSVHLYNAFSPNGDGTNDVFRVKEGYQSIVSFEAKVFDRWGKCLYTWTDLAGGWDGRSGGHEVPDGAYYLHIKARGADGRKYNIKKVINVLRRYTENMGGG